ncbi:MAG: FAD-dependent oxidoreductase [Planctomycetota bacterium]
MHKHILVLGAGVAGCSLAYFLKQKGYKVTLLEKDQRVGGLARTRYYAGHPYEFGPHIWFWPHDEINDVIRELSDNELLYIDRKLLSYIEKDGQYYRYPVHYEDIAKMPDAEAIYGELNKIRDERMKLIEERLPTIGQCTFEEYFVAALGETLYAKFMEQYTWKMWAIPGNELETSMVWADRVKHNYEGLKGYDPLKFEDHTLGKGLGFQIYPKGGWNKIWNKMVDGAQVLGGSIVETITKDRRGHYLATNNGKHYFDDYFAVINTLDVDLLWGESTLYYTGRLMIPLLIPGLEWAFPGGAESIYYSGNESQSRVTEMKRITQYQSPDTLILIEVPVTHTSESAFPVNVLRSDNFCAKAYPRQSEEAIARHQEYVEKSKIVPNLFHCGRHAQFKYWGMPETVDAAYRLVKSEF